jgi:hypothetical protein
MEYQRMSIYTHHIIYQTTNRVNNKIYIGAHSTNDLDDGYIGSGLAFRGAVKKHGKEAFSREILFMFDTPEQAYSKEAELVNEVFVSRQDTYNLQIGGGNFTEEHRQKISEAKKGKKGKPHSEETRQKMSEARKGKKRKPRSEETRRKISEARKGKPHSEETRQKISEAKKGKPLSEEARQKMSEAHRNISEETRQKMSEAGRGRKHTEETRRKISEAQHLRQLVNSSSASKPE